METDNERLLEDAKGRWERVQAQLRSELGDKVFERFLRPVRLTGAGRHQVELSAGSRFLRDFIHSNFSDRLYRLWRAEKPDIIAVEIIAGTLPPIGEVSPPAEVDLIIESACGPKIVVPTAFKPETGLVSAFRFDTFVVGSSNALAHEAARRIVAHPGQRYNPLFIYGPTGVGKTHLEHAIGNAVLEANPEARVRYLSAERFLGLFLAAIKGSTALAFKELYRSVDMLLIDDLQYIAGASREIGQKEFLHTLNALMAGNKQVVITADCAPGQLQGFDESMKSRLCGGLVVDVGETDSALRLGILQKLRESHDQSQRDHGRAPLEFAPNVFPYLSEHLNTNGRELSGAFNRISGQAEFEGVAVTVEFVQTTLRGTLQGSDRPPTIDEIMHRVSDYMGIKIADMKGLRRTQDIVRARHVAWWLCRELTERSYPQIAQKFGGRDHTTIIAGRQRIDDVRKIDPKLARDLDELIKLLKK